eukprot:IDg18120t1
MSCAFVGTPVGSSTFLSRSSWHSGCACAPVRPHFARRVAYAALDPTFVHHVPHIGLGAASHLLAAATSIAADGSGAVAAFAADTANAAAGAAGAAVDAARPSGPVNALAGVIENMLSWLHLRLQSAGVPGAYGLSIILFTGTVKALTFPLNWKQMESTIKLQAVNPRIQAIQKEYKDNPAVINQMTAKLYKEENINPLLGCLPILLQLPIWFALYRALQNLSKENLLNESFFWIPSLQGPVAQTGQGLSTWLFPFVDGQPPIGWHDAAAYLVLPTLLVFSQIISSRVMMSNSNDPNQQSAATFNKIIPVFIGW